MKKRAAIKKPKVARARLPKLSAPPPAKSKIGLGMTIVNAGIGIGVGLYRVAQIALKR